MARAAYAGLFTSISPLDFSCPHGSNCTWPAFTTLGVCSECNNITSRVNATCNTKDRWDICWYELIGPGDLPGNSSYPGPNAMPSSFGEFSSSTKFQSKCSDYGVLSWPLWFTWASRVWDQSRDLLSFTSYRFPKDDDARLSHCKLHMAQAQTSDLWLSIPPTPRVRVSEMSKLQKAKQQRRCKVSSERTEHVRRQAMILGRPTSFGSTSSITR